MRILRDLFRDLFDRQRVDRRTRAAGQMQRGRDEEKLIDAVFGAVGGEFLEIKYLAHGNPDGGDNDPVPRLNNILRFVGPYLAAPGIRADGRDIVPTDPITRLERKTRRVASGIARPIFGG